jgi:hypothetical protein
LNCIEGVTSELVPDLTRSLSHPPAVLQSGHSDIENSDSVPEQDCIGLGVFPSADSSPLVLPV